MSNKNHSFASMVSGLDFVGPDLTFSPREDSVAYGRECSLSFAHAMLDFIGQIDDAEVLDVARRLKPAVEAFTCSADRGTAAGQGFYAGMESLRGAVLAGRDAA